MLLTPLAWVSPFHIVDIYGDTAAMRTNVAAHRKRPVGRGVGSKGVAPHQPRACCCPEPLCDLVMSLFFQTSLTTRSGQVRLVHACGISGVCQCHTECTVGNGCFRSSFLCHCLVGLGSSSISSSSLPGSPRCEHNSHLGLGRFLHCLGSFLGR